MGGANIPGRRPLTCIDPEADRAYDDALESLAGALRDLLQCAVLARCNVLISRGTGSGKATTLNALTEFIGAAERIVTVEDAAELRLRHAHVVRLEARPATLEGRGEVPVRRLVRNVLRMRPDRMSSGRCGASRRHVRDHAQCRARAVDPAALPLPLPLRHVSRAERSQTKLSSRAPPASLRRPVPRNRSAVRRFGAPLEDAG